MTIKAVTRENIQDEHICCAISEKKGETCVADKKAWLDARFDDGLVFKKIDVRGKAFIEYIPAEKAWVPIDALGYMHINCLWVSGKLKGQGYSRELLDACIEDAKAKGKRGLTIISAQKKRSFLSDPRFLAHMGFAKADTAELDFVLYYMPFAPEAPLPSFRPQAKEGRVREAGIVLYYTDQCPFANTYAKRIAAKAEAMGVGISLHRLTSAEEAQASPAAWTTYCVFVNGRFVTNEVLSESRFEKLLAEMCEG